MADIVLRAADLIGVKQRYVVPDVEFRKSTDGVVGRFTARVLRYNVVDDYGTTFLPGVFDDSMKARMPRIVWSHDWSEPLGRWTKNLGTKESLILVGEMDAFEPVPQAWRAWAQLESGTIDQFSVGFMPEKVVDVKLKVRETEAAADDKGSITIPGFEIGRLDEVSLVLVGAVPGTELLSLRSGEHPGRERIVLISSDRAAVIGAELAAGILLDLSSGKISLSDALVKLAGETKETDDGKPPEGDPTPPAPGTDPPPPADPPEPPEGDGTPSADDEAAVAAKAAEEAELDAAIDDALAIVAGRL